MSSSQPAPKDKPKLGDSLPPNAINPRSLGGGCTNLLLHLLEGLKAGAGSHWDQEKGLVGQNPPFPTPNLLWSPAGEAGRSPLLSARCCDQGAHNERD